MRKHSRISTTLFGAGLAFLLALSIAWTAPCAAFAPGDEDATQARQREEVRAAAESPQGDVLRERIRERVKTETGLQEEERARLHKHLSECEQLGLSVEITAALFDETQPLRDQIRTQERVLAMAREGLPVEPVMQKLGEGRMKGVNTDVLQKVCDRMEANVRTAHQFMKRLRLDGAEPGASNAERERTREMATHMWRGLEEGDLDQLRERARLRLRDGSCTTEDFTAAVGTAARFKEMKVERHRAVRLAGDALENGYTAREMQQLRWMVMTAHMNGGSYDDVLSALEQGIRNQHQLTQMLRHMEKQGWMGPADMHGGRGGRSSSDAGGNGPGGAKGDKGGQGGGGDDKGGKGKGNGGS